MTARLLGLEGRWKEALAAFDAAVPPASAPLFQRGYFHSARADLITATRGADAVWAEAEAQFRLGCPALPCMAVNLAWVGDLERARRLDGLWPMVDRDSGCSRIYRALAAWRSGDVAEGLRILEGVDILGVAFFRGEMLLDAGRSREAVEEFRRYRRYPDRFDGTDAGLYQWPRSLYLEAVALERLGDRAGALGALDRLLRLWRSADADFRAAREARALRARLTAGGGHSIRGGREVR